MHPLVILVCVGEGATTVIGPDAASKSGGVVSSSVPAALSSLLPQC